MFYYKVSPAGRAYRELWSFRYVTRNLVARTREVSSKWASYQIRKIAGCACAGNAGNVYPNHRGLAIPTCITARASRTCRDAWRDRYLAVSFEVGGEENVTGILGVCATRNFTYLARGPWRDRRFELSLAKVMPTTNPHLHSNQCVPVHTYDAQQRKFRYFFPVDKIS